MFRFLIATVALLAVTGFSAVSAQEATPTPTPVSTSTITIRFVRDGQPVTVLLATSLSGLRADGVQCLIVTTPAGVKASGFSVDWPLLPAGGEPLECTKGPPTTLRFEFLTVSGMLSAEFVWTGSDVTFDIEVPAGTEVPPVELPITGGPPGAAGLTAVSAQEATPTPSPVPTSTITIRFVRDGQPVEVLTNQPVIIADGVECPFARIPEAITLSSNTEVWPAAPSPNFPTECTKGPPTTIRFEFETEFGLLSTEVIWTGSDINVNLEVPGSPTVQLPPTGAAPAEDPGGSRWFGLGLMAAGLIAASLGAMTWRLGRR